MYKFYEIRKKTEKLLISLLFFCFFSLSSEEKNFQNENQTLSEKKKFKQKSRKSDLYQKKESLPDQVNRGYFAKLTLEPTEGIIEGAYESFMMIWTALYESITSVGIRGWLKELLETIVVSVVFQLLYYLIIEPISFSKIIAEGLLFDSSKIGNFIAYYAPYFLEFILKSFFFSLLLSWIKNYIEALIGKKKEKVTTTERVYVTLVRTIILVLVVYDPLRDYHQFHRWITQSLWYNQIYIFITILFAMASFIFAEFWICAGKSESSLKNITKGMTKGFFTTLMSYLWFALLHTKLSDLDYLMKSFNIELWNREHNDKIDADKENMCYRLKEISQNADVTKQAAIFAFFSWGGDLCPHYEFQNKEEEEDGDDEASKKDKRIKELLQAEKEKQKILDSVSVVDGKLRLLAFWDICNLFRKRYQMNHSKGKDEKERTYSNETLGAFMNMATQAWASATKFYYKRTPKERSILQALVFNTLLAANPNL